ncbi:MAG: hypothetical protein ACFFBP_22070 [Promethearchaeota archaeon]
MRFIFPVSSPVKNNAIYNIEQFQENIDDYIDKKEILTESKKIRYLFKNLFVRKILDLVKGEDEIWMLESGLRNQLYVWKNEFFNN